MDELVEVRGIIRVEMLERVIACLKNSGVPRLTVTRVHAIGAGVDPDSARLSLDEGSAYADKAMVQFVCAKERGEMFAELIARAGRTGRGGDGIVSLHPVIDVTKVRTGKAGLAALE